MSEISWSALKKGADDAVRPLDEGEYLFQCTKAEYRKASTGSPMVVVTLAVQGGPKHGKTLMHNFVLTVDNSFALAMWFRNFAAFGITDEFFSQLSGNTEADLPLVANAMIGRSAMAVVKQRMFQGTMRNNFESFSPAAGAATSMPGPSIGVPHVGPSVGVSHPPAVPSAVPSVPTTPAVPSVPSPAPAAATAAPSVPSVPQPTGISVPPDDPF